MTDAQTSGTNKPDAGENRVTVVPVPESQVQAVLDFMATLESSSDDVSGHMLAGGMVGGLGVGALSAKKQSSMTGCSTTGGTGFGTDWQCSDHDVA